MPYWPLIVRRWREIAVGGALITLAAVCWYRGERIETLEAKLAAEQSRFDQQVSDYRAAYQTAVANAHAAARFVEVQQERITHEVSADYQVRIADVRARYQRLLTEAKAGSGGAGEADMSGLPGTTSGSDAGPAYCGLPAERALIATEQALQLSALQAWVRGQAGVDR
jgi:hypothetical protein